MRKTLVSQGKLLDLKEKSMGCAVRLGGKPPSPSFSRLGGNGQADPNKVVVAAIPLEQLHSLPFS
jgi:hypothetical protein